MLWSILPLFFSMGKLLLSRCQYICWYPGCSGTGYLYGLYRLSPHLFLPYRNTIWRFDCLSLLWFFIVRHLPYLNTHISVMYTLSNGALFHSKLWFCPCPAAASIISLLFLYIVCAAFASLCYYNVSIQYIYLLFMQVVDDNTLHGRLFHVIFSAIVDAW